MRICRRGIRGQNALKCSLAKIGLAALLCSAPAAATDWDSVAGWDVYEIDATRCVVGRVFPQIATTFGIIMGLDGGVRVFATAPGWATRAGQRIDAAVQLDGKLLIAGAAVGIEQQRNKGFVTAADAAFLTRFAVARQMTLQAGPSTDAGTVPLTGNAAGLAQGRRCVDALREEARSRPLAPAVASRDVPSRSFGSFNASPQARMSVTATNRAVARGSKAEWIEADDYPQAAIRAAEEGSVTVKLAIDARGSVAGCDVLKSSGSQVLDGATCKAIQRRARYKPATDGAGRAIAAVDQHTVRWTLPE